ncbi:metal ABC transporter solute-binding protein, Zn/Mn family [Candidatus Poriferisocius sp.]|uniref:metal ABC transporter solute-binding protein, Zn/Mn family n=1 Tax=Candidatus Poriferisocius sp. TaxID=3101276 RepID=UPI003B515F37
MRTIITFKAVAYKFGCLLAALALVAGGCGEDDSDSGGAPTVMPTESGGVPLVMATTSIWGDVLANVVCDGAAVVETLIPHGGDPHTFQPSLQDRGRMENAAMIVANGLGLEEGLEDTIDAVEEAGTPVFRMTDHVSTIEFSMTTEHDEHEDDHDDHDEHEDDHEDHDEHEDDHDDHDEHEDDHEDHDEHEDDHEDHDEHDDDHEDHDEHDDDHDEHEEHDDHDEHEDDHDDHDEHEGHEDHDEHDDHGHDHSGDDPHVWFDPIRVAEALPALRQALATEAGLDAGALDHCVAEYRTELMAIDAEIEEILAPLHPEDRLLITNHDALGYFAESYGFRLVGTVIPGGSTMDTSSPAELQELVELIEETGVAAIFSETTHSSDEAEALGREAGVQVVSLNTGALGPVGSSGDTYIGFLRTNAERIAESLG